ncbi:MAG: hypothetical protein AAF891_11885 [Pseudomonadota bacterium]
MTRFALMAAAALLAGCAAQPNTPNTALSGNEGAGPPRPELRPASLGRSVPKAAKTVEQFDVTTAEERAQAAKVPVEGGEQRLGLTIASLGDPTDAGFWIKTPLVKAQVKGRVVYPGTGKSVQVDLLPIDGEATAGSRLSLAAFRVIEAPLTELPQVEVFSGG